MRVHVVSDVHGNVDALARAGDGADALIVLGDLLDFVDYHDHGSGILGRVFGAEKVSVFARLRRDRQHSEAAAYARGLWSSLADPEATMEQAIREQYAELFAAITAPTYTVPTYGTPGNTVPTTAVSMNTVPTNTVPTNTVPTNTVPTNTVPTYATPGNVDVPALWPEYAGERVRVLDGDAVSIGGVVFGFVGGALLPPGAVLRRAGWFPYLRPAAEYDAAVAKLPAVDVLCSHIPPAVAELCYDVLARRFELGSAGLLRAIERDAPALSVFGHVHQPLARRMRVGRTECVNVGHFQRTGTPYSVDL